MSVVGLIFTSISLILVNSHVNDYITNVFFIFYF
jgi:hypothetical protein